MSDFKTLKGLFIKHVSSDPSNLIEGQIWYNTTTQTLKVAPLLGAWSSGGNRNNSMYDGTGFGIQTALVAAGGITDEQQAICETYDGSSWTETNDLNTARGQCGGAGTATAGLSVGGYAPGGNSATVSEWTGPAAAAVTFTSS